MTVEEPNADSDEQTGYKQAQPTFIHQPNLLNKGAGDSPRSFSLLFACAGSSLAASITIHRRFAAFDGFDLAEQLRHVHAGQSLE